MPRLSLWKGNKATNDYKFLDKTISEMYTVGGLDILVHKYLSPVSTGDATVSSTSENFDPTQPGGTDPDVTSIEDLFLLENRDRNYDPDIYQIRGVYNVQDIDFDLSQFGLFLQQDTLFITFHYNTMIDIFTRKIMSGDVIEVPNLKDYHPLDETISTVLPKLYVVQDASYASEGFSQTWRPHLWRIKATPLVGSQEYKGVLDGFANPEDTSVSICATTDSSTTADDATDCTVDAFTGGTLNDLLTTYNKDLEINDAVLAKAVAELPFSGYDVSKFYIEAQDTTGTPLDGTGLSTDSTVLTADEGTVTSDRTKESPQANGWLKGYLTGEGVPPNGLPVTPGTVFPPDAIEGDYVLRLDYFPNRLFRYDGNRWIKIEDGVRTDLSLGPDNRTQRNEFVNDKSTIKTSDRGNTPTLQGLSDLLKPSADN
jgi:hypothetical protein